MQADREARLALLRAKAQKRKTGALEETAREQIITEETSLISSSATSTAVISTEDRNVGHVNLFADAELAASKMVKGGKNAEYEEEKRAKEKKAADQFTWYLGETKDGRKETPWYASLDIKNVEPKQEGLMGRIVDAKKRKEKDEKRKSRNDPLNDMSRYLSSGGKSNKGHSRDHDTKPKGTISSSASSIEKLRAERLKREVAERRKAQELLQHGSITTRHEAEPEYYNSQFNPEFTRKRRERSRERQETAGRSYRDKGTARHRPY